MWCLCEVGELSELFSQTLGLEMGEKRLMFLKIMG